MIKFGLRNLAVSRLINRNTCKSITTLANNTEWSTWLSKYRLTVNQLFRDLSEQSTYYEKASDSHIDLTNWQSYVNKYRRNLINDPIKLLGSAENLSSVSTMVEEIHESAIQLFDVKSGEEDVIVKQMNATKSKVRDLVLKQACVDMKDYIAAQNVLALTSDLRIPHEWYPATRLMRRKIIYHGGPTNSGKTYQALQCLKNADVTKGGGLYCGPLRLLALEIYENLNRAGVFTSLLTGQEKREVPDATHISCTVEMVSINKSYDVAVIDEIQMIGNKERGHAWTRALQGLQAREIHVCGGLEAAEVVRSLAESAGDDFELKTYDRKTPLKVSEKSLRGDYSQVQPGDCIVAFSKADIFAIRRQIEMHTPYKCAIIYGQLPPETRSTQARLFNENNSGYDILVASDAIGMGLNLNIRRVIFHNTLKNFGPKGVYWVDPSSVKQIAGRAGRMSSDYKVGEVTAWQDLDLAYVRAVMAWDVPQIKSVGIFPSAEQIEVFSEQLNKTIASETLLRQDETDIATAPPLAGNEENRSLGKVVDVSAAVSKETSVAQLEHMQLSLIIERFVKLARTDGRYFICDHESMVCVSNWLHTVPLSISDRFVFANAPCNIRDPITMTVLYEFAATFAQQRPVPLKVRLSQHPPKDLDAFSELCVKFNVLELYLWLSFRFPKYFIEKDRCHQQKVFALSQIEAVLMSSTMGQTYSYSGEYTKIRDKLRKSGMDQYPPEEFGPVRATAKNFIDEISLDTRFVRPPARSGDVEELETTSSGRRHHNFRRSLGNDHKFGGQQRKGQKQRHATEKGDVMLKIDSLTATD